MQTSTKSIKKDTIRVLKSLGYKQELIDLAIRDSKTKKLEECLDLLEAREDDYDLLLSSQSNNKSKKGDSKKTVEGGGGGGTADSWESIDDEDGDDSDNSSGSNQKGQNYQGQEVQAPEFMDKTATVVVQDSIQHLQNAPKPESKNPQWYLNEVCEQLDNIKFSNNPAGTMISKYLAYNKTYKELQSYKTAIFQVIHKIMNMKIKGKLDIPKLEQVIQNGCELKILNKNHIENLQIMYEKFCSKLSIDPNHVLLNNLDKLASGINNVHTEKQLALDDKAQNILDDPVFQKCESFKDHEVIAGNQSPKINGNGVNGNHSEEVKDSDLPTQPILGPGGLSYDKEQCVICMEKIRDVVFLPCSHFLTCGECSVKIHTCPVCSKHIKKSLKIFWS